MKPLYAFKTISLLQFKKKMTRGKRVIAELEAVSDEKMILQACVEKNRIRNLRRRVSLKVSF
jgi:hypothetical protein